MKATKHSEVGDNLTLDEQMLLERGKGRILVFALISPLFFGVAKAISRQHAVLPDHEALILDFSEVPVLGVSSSLALETMVLEHVQKNLPVFIVGAEGDVEQRLIKLGLIEVVSPEHVVATRQEALERVNALLDSNDTGNDAPKDDAHRTAMA